jgi:HD-like signal output (HDOD) protein
MNTNGTMEQTAVKEYIQNLSELSTVPVLMGKIVSVLKDTEASSKEVNNLVSHDVTLAEKIVRVANSAFFGHSGEVRNINQATMLLGYDRIKSIALGMSVIEIFPSGGSVNFMNLWSHGYEVALASQAFSDLICMTCPCECFLSGLLHDIGRIILFKMDPKKFLEIGRKNSVLEQEQDLFGCTHAEAGALFAEMNNMPEEIVSAIRFHHKPSESKNYRDTVSIVSLAEAVSRRYSSNKANDGVWTQEHDILVMEYSLEDDDVLFIGERFCAARPDIESFFSPV